MRSAVTDYLLNLKPYELVDIAVDYLGWDRDDVTVEVAWQWVAGLSEPEVISIHAEMEGA